MFGEEADRRINVSQFLREAVMRLYGKEDGRDEFKIILLFKTQTPK